jgi:hypothetical protein
MFTFHDSRVYSSRRPIPLTRPRLQGALMAQASSRVRASQDAPASSEPLASAQPINPDSTEQPAIGLVFITAGHAVFTLQGRSSRFTYQVTRKDPEPGSRYTDPAFFISLLTGPDNTSDFTYLGMLNPETGAVRLTRASRLTDESPAVSAIRWAFGLLWTGQELPPPARIYHEGQCGRCGRRLTTPESIERGLGPECAGKV